MPGDLMPAANHGRPPMPASSAAPWLAAAVFFLACSGWLLFTLVLEEVHLSHDLNSILEDAAIIGVPGVAGLALAAIGLRRWTKK
ncbi:hypothetical protein [Couchioplanes caeruleus]|nr:hypothetical protein [Couchioplanes caeruleus]ROP28664.1 hypothetical protein EDD30_1433 [Couchioplanes caeruleus]